MEMCTIKETYAIGAINANEPVEPVVQLQGFQRALDIADTFQEYRISKVEYSYTPLYDTFNAAAGSGIDLVTVPKLYTKVQTVETPESYTLDYLIAQGAKPIRMDDKIIRHTYRPHVLQAALLAEAGDLATSKRAVKSPWLSTHSSSATGTPILMDNTIHRTHNFWIQQEVTSTATRPVCTLEVNVYFEFRKPWTLAAAAPTDGVAKRVLGLNKAF